MFWIASLVASSGFFIGVLYLKGFNFPKESQSRQAKALSYVKRRIECALFRKTDTTDEIFERLVMWFKEHPPSESLMQDLSLLQQQTDHDGGIENYYVVTVYAAAMQSVTDSFEPKSPVVRRTNSY